MTSVLSSRGPRSAAQRRAAAVLAAVGLVFGLALAWAPAAGAANSGTVTCYNQASVVGVWVTVNGGTSGWAARSGSGFQQRWSYNTQGRSYKLTVGCGGTPQQWAASTSTPVFSTTWSNVACFPGWGYGFGTIYVKDRCYAG